VGGSETDRWAAGTRSAPGRINLIGEHTDYNGGFVLPIAVPLAVTCSATAQPGEIIDVVSRQYSDQQVSVAVAGLAAERDSVPPWARYPLGVAAEFVRRGHRIGGVRLELDGQVPIGAGLSSSAALCCATATVLRDLYALTVGDRELISVAQAAENNFADVPTGVLDHAAAMLCRQDSALFLDVRSFRDSVDGGYSHIAFDLPRHRLALLVIDTGQPHRLADGKYAQRRAECAAAAHELGIASLRDADAAAIATLGDPVLRRRARHVVTENQRVLDVVDLLDRGVDPREIGPLLTRGHVSLRDDFEVCTPALDMAVTAAQAAGAYGARMVGGGFGGSVIALIEHVDVDQVAAAVRATMVDSGFPEPHALSVVAAAGAASDTGESID